MTSTHNARVQASTGEHPTHVKLVVHVETFDEPGTRYTRCVACVWLRVSYFGGHRPVASLGARALRAWRPVVRQ